ncbi:M20/M25/M40 family metallo-hydrolase [Agilicoccus flavus]|uniref:M20/M25/M40 family metallo-hydrolase n=1 Tax=Agilicoccus flavus TaxID=2775968 RepID=UPI0027DA5C91|nr:M20/M25/M40 family metallo-hydrolase [Agilicoccus flavus]
MRTWSPEVRTRFREHAATLASSIAAAHGLHAEVRHIDGYPVTVTDPDETDFAAGVVQGLLGDDAFAHLLDPLTGSEDFSRVLERVPGSFVGLGATGAGRDPATAPFNHSAHATFSDDVLPLGAAVYARLALSRLDVLARRSPVSTDRSPS